MEVDYSSSNLISCRADEKSKLPFLCNFDFFGRYLVALVNISLLSSILAIYIYMYMYMYMYSGSNVFHRALNSCD